MNFSPSTSPKISGFTFIKNGISLGYPIVESIQSIAPLCHEVIINVGLDNPDCTEDDGTYKYLKSIFSHPKYIFLKNYWDPKKTKNGEILAEQTDLSMKAATGDILQYIQGDEVLHEKDYPLLQQEYQNLYENPILEGLCFNYIHFYGNVNIVKKTRKVYRREIRCLKNKYTIKSWRDAQGFRKENGEKLKAKTIKAQVFHYGWCRQEMVMRKKIKIMDKLFHGHHFEAKKNFKYEKIWGLYPFLESHPKVMKSWIQKHRNEFSLKNSKRCWGVRDTFSIISDFIEQKTQYRLGEYKNFIEISE